VHVVPRLRPGIESVKFVLVELQNRALLGVLSSNLSCMEYIHSIEAFLNPDRIIALLTLIVATFGAYYAFRAPDKRDLKRVEANTAHLEGVKANISRMDDRMNKQHEHDALVAEAERISITVHGVANVGEPLPLDLLIKDHDIVLLRIELYSEVGVLFGSADCEKRQPLAYIATVDSDLTRRWFHAATVDSSNRRLLAIRAYMSLRGKEVYRQLPVYMNQETRQVQPSVHAAVFVVDGNV